MTDHHVVLRRLMTATASCGCDVRFVDVMFHRPFGFIMDRFMGETVWRRLIREDDCPVDVPRFVEAHGHELSVVRLANPDRIVVTANSCPHAGGNLAAGDVRGSIITCPWHQWQFDLDSGACPDSPNVRLRVYRSQRQDGWVVVQLD